MDSGRHGGTAVAGEPGSRPARPDAGCPAPPDVRTSVSARTAQTFTAVNSGRLTGAEAVVANGSRTGASDDYVLEIHEVDAAGVPTNADGIGSFSFTLKSANRVTWGRP